MIRVLLLLFFLTNVFANEVSLTQEEKAWIKDNPTITFGTDESWVPYVIKAKDGTLSGYDIDILKLISKNTGWNIKLVTGKWKDILVKAQKKEIDGLSTSAIHEERKKYFNFTTSYAISQRLLLVAKNNPQNINSLKDLDGKYIGYQEKNLFEKKLLSKYIDSFHTPLKNFEDILNHLITGKIDATLGSHAFIYYANQEKLPFLKVVDVVPNSKLHLVFSIRKDYPLALSIINKGLAAISEAKKMELYNKWFFANDKELFQKREKLNLTSSELAYLNAKNSLKVANLKGFPPFTFFENGMPKGYSIEYIKLIAEVLNKKIEFISHESWAELLKMIKAKKLDIMPVIAKMKNREDFIDYSNFVHVQFNAGLAKRKDAKIESIEDLEGKIIAVMNKSFLHKYLQKNFPNQSLLLTSSTSKALSAVSLGQADVVIGSLPVLDYFIQKNWLSNVKTSKVANFSLPEEIKLYIGVEKENKILNSIIEKANEHINLTQVAELKKKWMNIKQQGQESVLFNYEERQYLKKKNEITMCVDPNWMPFEKIEDGKHIGIVADYIKIIEKGLDRPIKLVETNSWLETLDFAKQRECDIISLATNSEKRRDYLLVTEPYITSPLVIATKINQPFINDISSVKNKKIGIVKGYAYGEFLRKKYPDIKLVEVKNIEDGLKKVQKGNIFALVGTLPAIGYAIQREYIGELKIAGKFKEVWDLGVAVRSDEPFLRDAINRVIKTIEPKQHQDILTKWISVNYEKRIDYDILFKVGFVFFLIIALIIYRNISVERLNQKLKRANKEIEDQQKMVDKYVLILSTDLNGVITEVNSAYCKATGFFKKELLGTRHEQLRHPDMKKEFFTTLWEKIRNDEIWVGEIKNLTKTKEDIFFNVYIEPIFKNKEKVGYRSISEDITDKKRIEKLSITDKLTGLYNRLKLDEVLVRKVQAFKRYSRPFSIILLDIDDFKKVNDTCGHDTGDKVLQVLSNELKSNIRFLDTIGRWGGEEFLIICDDTALDNAYILAEHLRAKIEAIEFECVGKKTISIGVAQFEKGDSISSIFKRVDIALYKAKNGGKNQTIKALT